MINRQLKIRYKQLGTMMEVCKDLICLAIAKECFVYNISYRFLSLRSVYHWLLLRPKARTDVAGHSSPFFSIFTFIILTNGDLWLGKAVLVGYLCFYSGNANGPQEG